MTKKSKAVQRVEKAAGVVKAKAKVENPFDKFANARKKHDVLNRRVKGEDRNVGRARAKAVDERKQKLLQQYQQNKRSNVVVDRRFGENDPTMSLEEKLFLRFQKERMKKSRNSSIYNLDESADDYGIPRSLSSTRTESLTHKGQTLSDSNMQDHDWISSDDEEATGKLDKEVVNALHFGGGLVEKKSALQDEEPTRKGRLDALQEIVMKSKMFKMQRKEAKEEQEMERDRLDDEFDSLFKSKSIEMDMKTNRSRRSEPNENEVAVDDYDKMMAEMMYEAKVQPTDRTKTDEELALEERERLEELEKARLKRMRHVRDEERGKNSKKRVKNDDELDDFDFQDNYGKTAPTKPQTDEEDDEEEEEDNEEDEDFDSEDEEEDESGDEEEGSSEEGDSDDEEEEEEGDDGDDDSDVAENAEEEEEDLGMESESDEENVRERGRRQRMRAAAERAVDVEHLDMPVKIDCPTDSESFEELLQRYTRSTADEVELIKRIAKWNNVHLPGQDGMENKKNMHNFLDILLKYFVHLADKLIDEPEEMSALDGLTAVIFQVCVDLQDSARQLWSRTLKFAHAQLQKQMRDYAQGVRDSCWPSLGKLLLFQLLGHVFSVSDWKNDIVFPASVFLCQCLIQCPVTTVRDLVSGLLACSILAEYNMETSKFIPEVLSFLTSSLAIYLPNGSTLSTQQHLRQQYLHTFKYENLAFLRVQLKKVDKSASESGKIHWNAFKSAGSSLDHLESSLPSLAAAIVSSVYNLIDLTLVSKFSTEDAFRELSLPAKDTLALVSPHVAPKFPKFLQEAHLLLLESIVKSVNETVANREHLQWRKTLKTVVDSKAPKFDPHYTMKKESDPDKDRVKLKQLNRQLKREKKAAMRELRRDSAFLDEERFKEKTAANAARKEERHKNFAWLEEQQATINEQVRKGKDLLKGGGSGVGKKSRVKRL